MGCGVCGRLVLGCGLLCCCACCYLGFAPGAVFVVHVTWPGAADARRLEGRCLDLQVGWGLLVGLDGDASPVGFPVGDGAQVVDAAVEADLGEVDEVFVAVEQHVPVEVWVLSPP